MIDLNKHKLELEYPCNWIYTLIVADSCNIKKTVCDVIDKREHNISESKKSSKGKYKSYKVELIVHNDDDRTELHKLFGSHKEIKMIV